MTEDAAGIGETFHARRTNILEEIVTDVECSAAYVFRTPAEISQHGTDETTPQYGNTAIGSTWLAPSVRIGGSTTSYPSRTGSQDNKSPRGSIGTK